MIPLIEDLRKLELKICDRLNEVEQLELHNLLSCVEQRIEGLQELTNNKWERL